MNPAMREKRAYWIGGTLTAALGVGLVRLVSPALAGVPGAVASAAGYLLVILGITIIALATRRKRSEALIAVENGAADHDRR